MKSFLRRLLAVTGLCLALATPALADLDGFLANLNVQASTDMHGYSVKLGGQFSLSDAQVQTVLRAVEQPSDAFMCFQLAAMSKQPPEVVLQTIKKKKGKGWGVIAKELGIKPGSPEFHALKRGDFVLTGVPQGEGQGSGKGKGKGKGHNK